MNDVEQRALAMELKTPRGRTFLTFLKEMAISHAMSAMNSVNRDEVFAHSQRGAGLMDAHKQLEAMANEQGDYGRNSD
jgi:hypothetical protein